MSRGLGSGLWSWRGRGRIQRVVRRGRGNRRVGFVRLCCMFSADDGEGRRVQLGREDMVSRMCRSDSGRALCMSSGGRLLAVVSPSREDAVGACYRSLHASVAVDRALSSARRSCRISPSSSFVRG